MGYVLTILIITILCFAFFGICKSNTDELSDYDLYGMDSDEYLKNQVGEDYYNKNYK
jgi:hypothetical protein